MERGGFHSYQKFSNTSSANNGNHGVSLNVNVNVNVVVNEDNECTVREQDRYMPIANVIRIMRKILPPHAKISDDAKETIQECVSEYISFITSEANDRCQREQRKTITAEDVLYAMSKLGFDDYIEPLTHYLQRYREMEGERGGPMRGGSDSLAAVVKRSNNNNNNNFEFGSMLGIATCTTTTHHHHQNGWFFGGAFASAATGTYSSSSSRELRSNNAPNSSSQPAAWPANGTHDAFIRHNK